MLDICLGVALLFAVTLTFGIFFQKQFINKLLFLNSLTSMVGLFICFLGTYSANDSYVDIAIIYFLLSFIATAGYLRFFLEKA